MNNVNMGGMNAMGGPVGGGVPAMNNGTGPGRQAQPGTDNRSQLNTYIYEYFLKNEMWECARSLYQSESHGMSLLKDGDTRRREDGTVEDGGDGDSQDISDTKRPQDLPAPNLPKDTPESCFLYEWWSLFWDMFNAQRGSKDQRSVLQYVNHTQAASRMRQEQQQAMLQNMKLTGGGNYQNMNMMMRGQPNGMSLNQNELRQKAIQNNRNQPQNMQMLAQQKQQQMQRDPSNQDQQRPQSPGSAENAPSPSKRPRLDGAAFNPQQQMPNGRGQAQGMPQQVGDTNPSNAIQAHMQLTNGIDQNNLTGQQFPNMPGAGGNANTQARSLAGYQANLAQQQQSQMPVAKGGMPNQVGPQNQGSPMMGQGQGGGDIANYYNPGDNPGGLRGGPQQGGAGGNHALQDYQMQLMLLEQQNKKRLMMARQEQDGSMNPRPDGSQGPGGPGQMGPNGQPYQGTSPQGPRSVNSPNPGDQMKRGTPHMGQAGIPSPLPEGQSRGSPNNMNFNMPGGPLDPNIKATGPFFNMNGMDPNMVGGGMPNGMRPPSSHPGGGQFNPMTQQAMAAQARQQQGWQQGPNGQMMPQGQAPPQQTMGTPQQRAMPPPSAPATGTATNGRTQPSSPQQNAAPPTPQQANKANPKKKAESKDSKAKRATKKGSSANLNAGATPSAEADTAGATPAPATPATPAHPNFKGQNGAVQPAANGQPPAQPVANVVPQQQNDQFLQGGGYPGSMDIFEPNGMDFTHNGTDVLQDFDFDSFLHQDGGVENDFNFDASAFLTEDGGIGAE